jgi:hypothetical protein
MEQPSSQRRRPSAALLIALLALVVSLGATTATAAGVITGAQIKNGSVTTADIKNNNLKGKDVKDAGLTGADIKDAGLTGADVKDGTIELNDLSAATKAAISTTWDPSQTLVSGQTITGSVFYVIDSSAAGQTINQTFNFPARAPAALVSANFRTDASAVTTDDDATCTGTYALPTAPAGKVCGYPASFSGLSAVSLDTLFPGQDKGFIVRGTASAAGGVTVDFSWAYTAP